MRCHPVALQMSELAHRGRGTRPWKQLVRASSGISTYVWVFSARWRRIFYVYELLLGLHSTAAFKSSEHKGRPELSGWEAPITSIWWGGSFENGLQNGFFVCISIVMKICPTFCSVELYPAPGPPRQSCGRGEPGFPACWLNGSSSHLLLS